MAAVSILEDFEVAPNSEIKVVVITLPNTTDASDTVAVTLSNYGIAATGLLIVEGWVHTTDGSVIASEAVTSSVTAGVATITIPAGSDNDFRVIRLTGKGVAGDFS